MTAEHDSDGMVTGINVTPLVDITLVLLIIFMVTAHFVNDSALKIQLPKAAAAEAIPPASLTVSAGKTGELSIAGQKLDLNALKLRMTHEVRQNPQVRVLVAADESLVYRNIVAILDTIKAAGVSRVALSAEAK